MSEQERDIFVEYYTSQLDSRWERLKWIKEKEREYDVRMLYHNSTLSYVFTNFLASILSICSAIEAYLSSKISPEKVHVPKYLSQYIRDAFEENLISENTSKELSNFNNYIRNHVVHPKGPTSLSMLGFKITQYTGRKTSWESPDRKTMLPLSHKDAAEKGILLFLQVVKECLKI